MPITHSFSNPKSDGGDATITRPSDWNADHVGYSSGHGARVKRASTSFSVGNNTLTAVQFDAEDFDTDTIHDNSTNPSRLTIPSITGVTTAIWSIKASGYSDATSGAVDCLLRVGGSTPIAFERFFAITSPAATGYFATTDYVFTAGDYVECLVRTTGGSYNAIFDAGVSPIFSIAFIGRVT